MYSKAVENECRRFVGMYGEAIIAAITDTGLFFQAVVAQKALESGWGKSELAEKYNNFGGIKNFGSLPGAGVVMMDTTEVKNGKKVSTKQPFAVYENPVDAFKSYVAVLKDPSKKYTSVGVFTAATPEEQIKRMAVAGYTTTAPDKYLAAMKGIIEACTDLYPYGKIETASTATLDTIMQENNGLMGSAMLAATNRLKNYFKAK